MHISFIAHDSKSNASSAGLIQYLEKENHYQKENGEFQSIENYFNTDYNSVNSNQELEAKDIIYNLDSNRGTQKLSSSNFYMLNISPSKKELEHMELIAERELKNRGLEENNNEASKILYKEQKDELIKMQLKLYVKDVMVQYAGNFNREIYINEDKLPNKAEKIILNKETDKQFEAFLKSKNIELAKSKSNEETKSKEWVTVNNVTILKTTDKSFQIELDLEKQGKANVFVPKATLQVQPDGSYKMPENLFKEKQNEVIAKNRLVEINYDYISTGIVPINRTPTTVLNFEKKDDRFSDKLNFSFDEKDVVKDGNKYFVSEHLMKEKEKYSLQKAIGTDFSNEKENIYNRIATEKGFDMSKRPLEEKDLLWYAKVETKRSYRRTDKIVLKNVELQKEIKILQEQKVKDKSKIKTLENQLYKNSKGEVIKAGDKKEGNQYHVHVVVSRHDKTMKDERNKISLSPLANSKENNTNHNNGAKVGFDRNNFFQNAETVFDSKFNYDRPAEQSFQSYKHQKMEITPGDIVETKAKGEAKQFLMKHSGIGQAKAILNPIQDVKKELGIANIPTRFPKNFVDLAYKVAKNILSKGIEY